MIFSFVFLNVSVFFVKVESFYFKSIKNFIVVYKINVFLVELSIFSDLNKSCLIYVKLYLLKKCNVFRVKDF